MELSTSQVFCRQSCVYTIEIVDIFVPAGGGGSSRQFSNRGGRAQWSLLLGPIMTWVEVLKYPVVIITWVHYDLGGGADVPGVPSGHY